MVTGYDDAILPSNLSDVECLRKAVELRQIVNAIARVTGS
jgi:hypothetical protein